MELTNLLRTEENLFLDNLEILSVTVSAQTVSGARAMRNLLNLRSSSSIWAQTLKATDTTKDHKNIKIWIQMLGKIIWLSECKEF